MSEEISNEKPTIFFKEKGWVMSQATRELKWSLDESGWIFNRRTNMWYTKDDELVNARFIKWVREIDLPVLTQRLFQKALNLKASYDTGETAPHKYEGLYPFQNITPTEVVQRNILLADEMGLGKTVQAIMAINEVKPKNCLIVVPNMLVHSPWYSCIEKWLTYTECQVYIVPWSRLVKMDLDVYWDMCIVDEAHYAKNPTSARSKAFSALKAEHKMCLTGTPILGRPIEIWPIIQWLEPYLLGTQAEFERNYCTEKWSKVPTKQKDYDGNTIYRVVKTMSGAKNMERLQKKLRETVMIARFKKDVLPQLPPKSRSIIQLNVGADITRLENQMLSVWQEIKKQSNDLKLWSNIFAIRKASALLKVPYVNAVIDEIWDESNNDVAAILSSDGIIHRPIVVWTHHHEVADAIYDHFKTKGLSVATLDGRKKPEVRSKIVEEFQAGKMDILVCGLTSAGVGITLTKSDIAVFAELDWTPANMVQAEDRLHRIGQEKNVSIYYCVSPNSLDGRFAAILTEKQTVIDAFSDLQSIIEEV
jgi:SWI/SNF-related matrix-associated actin-dependent regulator 1 of chromatin subfamily A